MHEDAEMLEHHISDRVLEASIRRWGTRTRIRTAIRFPTTPAGAPGRSLRSRRCPRGRSGRAQIRDADEPRMALWKSAGLRPGAEVGMLRGAGTDDVFEIEISGRLFVTGAKGWTVCSRKHGARALESRRSGRVMSDLGRSRSNAGEPLSTPSLSEVHRTFRSRKRIVDRRLFAFAGPAYLVSVGYMDPGNWATDLAGGARFGYQLVWVLLMSNLMAVLLQTLSARLGVVTGKDLAQACRDYYPAWVSMPSSAVRRLISGSTSTSRNAPLRIPTYSLGIAAGA